MTDLRTAAQQALEALEAIREADTAGATPKMVVEARKMYEPTITALRAALAEPVQTPHLFPLQSDRMRIDPVTGNVGIGTPSAEPVAWFYQNMYTEQEYLVWKKGTGGRNWRPLYTAQPQRKPLTEEEIIDLWAGVSDPESPDISMIDFARAIERAYGIGGNDE